jgi:hypothetical protein
MTSDSGRRDIRASGTRAPLSVWLNEVVFFPLLAFGIPGNAPDECPPSKQPNDWSCREPHQKSRCKEPSFCSPPYGDTCGAGRQNGCERISKRRQRRSECGPFGPESSQNSQPDWTETCPHGDAIVAIKKRQSVTSHSVFLRDTCALPDRVNPVRTPFGQNWSQLEKIEAPAFDAMIRREGWHFIWVQGACSRRGFGATEESATLHAVTHALHGIARRFNAAEFDSLQITNYPGFCVAKVTMQAQQIQQNTSLDVSAEDLPRAVLIR